MKAVRSMGPRWRARSAMLGTLVLMLLMTGCSVSYLPELFLPPPGPTVVVPSNVPSARCSVGRIGLNINDALEVIGFTGYSPARNAGLRFGDIVRSIDGVPPRSLSHAQTLTSGPPGTFVNITVWRHTSGRHLTYNVRRDCI